LNNLLRTTIHHEHQEQEKWIFVSLQDKKSDKEGEIFENYNQNQSCIIYRKQRAY